MKSGYIPEEVNYHCRPKQVDSFDWGSIGREESVIPAFCCDSTNPRTNETAKKWAKQTNVWDYETHSWKKTDHKEHIVTRKNTPIDGKQIRIIGIDMRGNGGRAYKVLIDDTYYFDMREDVILDTIFKYGINKNGILNGKFLWGMNGSQMKLILEGSDLHKELIKANENKKKQKSLKRIKNADLVVGGIYTTATEQFFCVYIGKALKQHTFIQIVKRDNVWKLYSFYINKMKTHSFTTKVDQLDTNTINEFISDIISEYNSSLVARENGYNRAGKISFRWNYTTVNDSFTSFEEDPWVISIKESLKMLDILSMELNA